MYDWLELELNAVKTPRFHVIDGPARQELRDAVMRSVLRLPEAYKEFVLRFGNAKLYRCARTGYTIEVFAGPRDARFDDGVQVFHIGYLDGTEICIVPSGGEQGFHVWEKESGVSENSGKPFDEWLEHRCSRIRSMFTRKQWKRVLQGPEPFNEEERDLIEARRQIHWKVLEIDPNGDHVFEIYNRSQRCIPLLSLGVRSRDKRLNGEVWLRIGHVAPGQRREIRADCYKALRPPEQIEIFDLPEPLPEDRDYYRELKESVVRGQHH